MPNPTVDRFDPEFIARLLRDGGGVLESLRDVDCDLPVAWRSQLGADMIRAARTVAADYSALQSECERLRAAVKSKEPTCGWEKFYALVIGEFAHLARNLIEGEVLTYDLREHVMILGDYAKTAAGALRAASAIDAALAQSAKGE